MSNAKQNDNLGSTTKDAAASSSAVTKIDLFKGRFSFYVFIILIIFSISVLLEILGPTLSTETTSLLPAIQIALLVMGLLLAGFVFIQIRSTNTLSTGSSQVRLLNDRIALKTHSLEILYDAAAGVTNLHGLDELLKRFLITLKNLARAQAATVRLLTNDNLFRLVAKTGISDDKQDAPQILSLAQCLVGTSIADSPILKSQLDDSTLPGFISLRNNNLTLITIPVRYSGKTLGVFHLLLDDTDLIEKKEIIQLFTSIGRHLGIVVEKVNLENNARRLSIIKERTSLANELHDSLAQTLASLRYQVTMVEETVGQSRDRTGILQIRTIKEGLDQANSQLRELLAHFRTRMDERGLLPAIGTLVERFEKQTGIAVYFQNEVTEPILSPAVEVQVLHIVQEALSNIRKHSQAKNVRVLIRSDENGNYYVLVEDDGQGIQEHDEEAGPGEHVGLSIMKERAERISGTFSIETEPGEGTRVELHFHAPNESKNL